MKKTLFIICICLSMILSSCNASKVEYCIYYETSDSADRVPCRLDAKNATVKGATAAGKNFHIKSMNNIEKKSGYKTSRELEVGGIKYDLDYKKSYVNDLYSLEKYKSVSEFDRYMNDDSILAEFKAGTDTLIFFVDANEKSRKATGNLTEEQAKELAKAVITDQYGEDMLREYDFERVIYTDDRERHEYTVVYTKYIHGMPTNDSIQIGFNMRGEVLSINAMLMGIYNDAEKDVSKKQIEAARNVLYDCVPENWEMSSDGACLIIDSLGDYYLELNLFGKREDGTSDIRTLYINVK